MRVSSWRIARLPTVAGGFDHPYPLQIKEDEVNIARIDEIRYEYEDEFGSIEEIISGVAEFTGILLVEFTRGLVGLDDEGNVILAETL